MQFMKRAAKVLDLEMHLSVLAIALEKPVAIQGSDVPLPEDTDQIRTPNLR